VKRIIPYILIFAVLVGLFSPLAQVQADACTGTDATTGNPTPPGCTPAPTQVAPTGTCTTVDSSGTPKPTTTTQANCPPPGTWIAEGTAIAGQSALLSQLDDCGVLIYGSITGCVEGVVYFIFVTIPSFLMGLVANLFDFVVGLTISSSIYGLGFIQTIWVIVRNFANIFFILILLYAAFQIILGLDDHGGKKIIGMVILVALLVNFSLFFTRIVIDASNVTALIFYNRIDTSDVTYEPISKASQTGTQEKDIAGALVSTFNINTFFNPDFLNTLKTPPQGIKVFKSVLSSVVSSVVSGAPQVTIIPETDSKIGVYLLVSMMVAYGLVVYALIYSFFIAGLSFFGRMINLIMLMVVSPFAFVTAAVPKFKSINTIGFDSWIKKLLESSFMAAIFMFILYITSQILNAQIFAGVADTSNTGVFARLVIIFVPAILIVILLLKGASYAKKASAEFTEKIITGTKIVGGLALGGAAGLALGTTAAAGRRVVGGGGGYLANKLADKAQSAGFGRTATRLRDVSAFAQKSSFDVRGVKVAGKSLASTGLKVGEAQKGGWSQMKKEQIEKRQKRAEELEKRGTSKEKKDVQNAEIALKEAVLQDKTIGGVTLPVKLHLQNADKVIDKARIDLNDAKNGGDLYEIARAKAALDSARNEKETVRTAAGLPALEKVVNKAKVDLEVASDKITTDYAKAISGNFSKNLNSIFRLGAYSRAGADEAARKIRSGTKLDSGEKPK
jgi:hypothetical protein